MTQPPKNRSLVNLFCGLLSRQGYNTTPYEAMDMMGFENRYITGIVMFRTTDKNNHVVRWKCRQGYELYDVPFSVPGWASSEFKKAPDLLNFLQRRLIWKRVYA